MQSATVQVHDIAQRLSPWNTRCILNHSIKKGVKLPSNMSQVPQRLDCYPKTQTINFLIILEHESLEAKPREKYLHLLRLLVGLTPYLNYPETPQTPNPPQRKPT